MKQLNIQDILFNYVTDTSKWFYWYHSPQRLEELYKQDHEGEPDYKPDSECNFIKRRWRFKGKTVTRNGGKNVVIEENLADFFDAVLDEVRLKKANDFSEYALYISDNEDLAYFRNTVAKREVIADIDYNKQRDHAVHTLYNYLLGWYIFEHSKKLQGSFESHFNKILAIDLDKHVDDLLKFYTTGQLKNIKIPDAPQDSVGLGEKSIRLVHEFADVWTIVSLLHDIGYILEGSLSSASPDVEHLRVSNGSKIIHDYFNHYFWKSFEVDFRVGKNIAKTLGVVVPDFRYSESLASLGDRLCDIGSCENIRKELNDIPKFTTFEKSCETSQKTEDKNYQVITEEYGLNREAFSIWKEHYKFHNKNKTMEDILCVVERVYKNMLWVGSDYGKRNLDHGVCSGLITLQALTFFRELFWGFWQTEWETAKNTRPLMPAAAPVVLLHSLDTQQGVSNIFLAMTRRDVGKACIFTTQKTLRENTCTIASGDYSTPVSQRKPFKDKQGELNNDYDRVSRELFERIKNEIIRVPKRIRVARGNIRHKYNVRDKPCTLRSDFWFNKILWATAASAIHSIIQKPEYKKQCLKHLNIELKQQEQHNDSKQQHKNRLDNELKELETLKIGVDDDPLAFLGVFVDILQEWDRYKVTGRGEAVFSGDEPLQSTRVYLYPNKDKLDKSFPKELYMEDSKPNGDSIYLMYPAGDNEKKDWITELKKTMGYGLKDDWNSIVEIVAYVKSEG